MATVKAAYCISFYSTQYAAEVASYKAAKLLPYYSAIVTAMATAYFAAFWISNSYSNFSTLSSADIATISKTIAATNTPTDGFSFHTAKISSIWSTYSATV